MIQIHQKTVKTQKNLRYETPSKAKLLNKKSLQFLAIFHLTGLLFGFTNFSEYDIILLIH